MAITTYPLNDIEYTAEDAELYNCTRGSGVYSGDDFTCTVNGTNNNVVIGEGVGWIRNGRFAGKVFANREAETIALDVADAVYPRIDVVGVRYETATNRTDIVVKKGTASANPVMPDIVQTETVYELYFYSVYREAAATVITADNVTDLRLDANYCGLMGDAITSIDTSAINAQFQAFLAKIKNELADLKIGKIDAYSREETLSPTTKTLLGLAEDAVPDDAFAQLGMHWWKRRTEETGAHHEESLSVSTGTFVTAVNSTNGNSMGTIYYASDYTVENGIYYLSNYNTIDFSYMNGDVKSCMSGKYFIFNSGNASSMYYGGIEDGTSTFTIQWAQSSDGGTYYLKLQNYTKYNIKTTTYTNLGEYEYVSSTNRNAYPDSGTEGIFSYQYLGIPFENARDAKKWAIVSYTGTNTYGASSPCSITADFPIKHFWCLGSGSASVLVVNPDVRREEILQASGWRMWFNVDEKLTEEYQQAYGFSGRYTAEYMKRSADGKTISWYSTESAAYQKNESNKNYYFFVAG